MKLLHQFMFLVIAISIINIIESKLTMEQIQNTFKAIQNACKKRSSIEDEVIQDLSNGIFNMDMKVMCFCKCLWQKLNMMKNDRIDLHKISQKILIIPDEIEARIMKVYTDCYGIASKFEDSCQESFEFTKCLYESDRELFPISP